MTVGQWEDFCPVGVQMSTTEDYVKGLVLFPHKAIKQLCLKYRKIIFV